MPPPPPPGHRPGQRSGRPHFRTPLYAGAVGLALCSLAFALVAVEASPVSIARPAAAAAAPASAPSVTPSVTPSLGPSTPTATAGGFTAVTETIAVGSLVRSFEVVGPVRPAAARIPALIVLHGTNATIPQEEGRDGLGPLVVDGQAVLVYPAGYHETWNAGSCCGAAQASHIDDVSFVAAVVHRMAADPGIDQVYLAGYSNGGKLVYAVACADPSLVAAIVVVGAVPGGACPPGNPVSLLQIAGTKDERVPYTTPSPRHIANGFREATALQQVATWRTRDACGGDPVAATAGALQTQAWTCSTGTRVELATYEGGDHGWPAGGNGTPSGAAVIWEFLTGKALPGT